MKKIVNIHQRISEYIQKKRNEKSEIEKQNKELCEICGIKEEKSLTSHALVSKRILQSIQTNKELLEQIDDELEKYSFYLFEYLKIDEMASTLNKSCPISFMKMKTTNKDSEESKQLLTNYLNIVEKYGFSTHLKNDENKANLNTCKCGHKKFIIEQTAEICEKCGNEKEIYEVSTQSRSNTNKVNIKQNFCYERKIHFKEAINQFSGKQNTTIKPTVYKQIEEQLQKYRLLQNSNNNQKKYENVTKHHILMILKELKLCKHYEDYILIFHNMTGKKINDISHLEHLLMEDFDMFIKEYDKKMINNQRKSFINTRILLYQLLVRRKYPCKAEDFNILKTLERLAFHDEIIQDVFHALSWNYTKLF